MPSEIVSTSMLCFAAAIQGAQQMIIVDDRIWLADPGPLCRQNSASVGHSAWTPFSLQT